MATEVVARFDHDWGVVGMSRALDACPGLKYDELLREELRCQLGSLGSFTRVPLEEIPEPRRVYRAAARVDVRDLDPEPQPDPAFPADVRGMGLARAVNSRALNAIIGLCSERVRTEAHEVLAHIREASGRFTDVVLSTMGSAYCLRTSPLPPGGGILFDFGAAMSGVPGNPLKRAHGLAVRIDGRLGDSVALCVNRRNMLLGLGDGRFSYDRDRGRLHMSVKFALDVSRADPGLMIDFREDSAPDRIRMRVTPRQATRWDPLDPD